MSVSERRTLRRVQLVVGVVILVGAFANPAWAHRHQAEPAHGGEGQFLANGANHPRFIDPDGDGNYESCESYGPIPGSEISPAWYGLETAHHGRDSGDPGKGDDCYLADGNPGSVDPALRDDQNPAIG